MMTESAAIILGGGRSSRIGRDKCVLEIDGRPILEVVLSKLKPLFEEMILVTNTPDVHGNNSDLKIVTDEVPYQGPLGGILAGLSSSLHRYNLVVACDMPFLNIDLIQFLFDQISGADVVIPCSKKGIEPLHAVYSTDCIPAIREKLECGEKRVVSFFDQVRVHYVKKEKVKELDPQYLSFFNINTVEDWELAQKIHESSEG